jgi:osmotically-inducible protein OsmY
MKAYIVLSAALLAGCAASAAHESTGEYLDDTAITTKVKTELLTAADIAGSVSGVKAVRNDIQVR